MQKSVIQSLVQQETLVGEKHQQGRKEYILDSHSRLTL